MIQVESEIQDFVSRVTENLPKIDARLALFYAIRNYEYCTDGAYDALGLIRMKRGNCLAKSDLMIKSLKALGYDAQRIRYLYELPNSPSEVESLPSKDDIHSAARLKKNNNWIFVDATHDPLLSNELVVSHWDGINSTELCYIPKGPIWVEGEHDREINQELSRIGKMYEALDTSPSYMTAFNAWLNTLRRQHIP